MPLKVIVVGAGLGGLATAIALTRAGHDVDVFEKSSFHNEVGAAIHLAPNATRVLKSWDCDLESMDPSPCNHISLWKASGEFVTVAAVTKDLQAKLDIKDEWLLVHRVDLHNKLRELAEKGFEARKPRLHLSCGVSSVDVQSGKVKLYDGREFQADLIIGADGVHSKTVREVQPESQKRVSTGQNCFRFLVPTEKAMRNPLTKSLIDRVGLESLNTFATEDCRIILYPCRSGKLLNLAAIYRGGDEEVEESSWLNSGSKSNLLEVVKGFSPELQELCNLAEDVKLWSLASRDPPTVFHRGRLGLIGDAAHPTLPHQGQGGAQAFEDAAALGALFTADTKPEQIEEKLRLYNEIRYKQSVTILFMSRVADGERKLVMDELHRFVPDAELPENMWLFAWNSYPARAAEKALSLVEAH
ncbi:Salicylate 1-monooxygenase [Ascochyta rabiei]|uniref:Salicylate 1-monooxygenase n=1 Tax=Didymella rabiei TaxID=5454 RepID=A0A163M3D9_DIDRA|nr:Salicylate 1-monooxygenase [Ascochyta rabiei]KZM28363.1 salicylate 1-monooxygenase [Ascochyta rabiei]UPX14715.1 Salicylate 1-monooxygenase [Ascochyta rabiei]